MLEQDLECCLVISAAGFGCCATVEEELQDGGLVIGGGDGNSSAALFGFGVNIGFVGYKKARDFDIVEGPEKRSGSRVIRQVGIGFVGEELADGFAIGTKSCMHQRRIAVGTFAVDRFRVFLQGFFKGHGVAGAEGGYQAHGAGICGRQGLIAGERVRPLGALFNPGADKVDLVGFKGTGEGHLRAIFCAGDAEEDHAGFGVAGADADAATSLHSRVPAVQAHGSTLLFGSVAVNAVFLEEGLDVALKVYFGRLGEAKGGRQEE